MKNLWKYLSTLGLMFVACLCLGVGLKAGEKAEAKSYTLDFEWAQSGSVMTGGTIRGGDVATVLVRNSDFTIKDGTVYASDSENGVACIRGSFTMDGGAVGGASVAGIYVSQSTFIMNSGKIEANHIGIQFEDSSVVTINGGTISTANQPISISGNDGTLNVNGGTIEGQIGLNSSAQMIYSGGTINGRITLSSGSLTLKKAPTQTLNINCSVSVGTKVAKLEGISTLDLSKLSVENMTSNYRLEIQEIDGEKWVVVAEKPCKVTLKCNIEGGAQFYPDNDSSNKSNTIVVEVKKGGSFNHHQAMVDFTGVVSGRSRYFVTVNTDKFQSDTTNNRVSWYINDLNKSAIYGTSYTINEDTTIIYRVNQVKCTITFTAMSVLGNPARYSTTSSTTAYTSASAQYSIDVDTNSTIQVYQKKIIVGSTTVYVIFKSGQVYSSASITGVLGIYLPSSTSSQTVKITQDVRVIYQGKASSFLAQGEEEKVTPEVQRGIEVVIRDEDKIVTKPAVCIVPSGNEIVVRKRHEI